MGGSMQQSRSSMQVSVRAEFCAASRLWREDWSAERNREVYGVCASPHGHGHNYLLRVTVAGEPDLESGMVMDYTKLQAAVDEHIVRAVLESILRPSEYRTNRNAQGAERAYATVCERAWLKE